MNKFFKRVKNNWKCDWIRLFITTLENQWSSLVSINEAPAELQKKSFNNSTRKPLVHKYVHMSKMKTAEPFYRLWISFYFFSSIFSFKYLKLFQFWFRGKNIQNYLLCWHKYQRFHQCIIKKVKQLFIFSEKKTLQIHNHISI